MTSGLSLAQVGDALEQLLLDNGRQLTGAEAFTKLYQLHPEAKDVLKSNGLRKIVNIVNYYPGRFQFNVDGGAGMLVLLRATAAPRPVVRPPSEGIVNSPDVPGALQLLPRADEAYPPAGTPSPPITNCRRKEPSAVSEATEVALSGEWFTFVQTAGQLTLASEALLGLIPDRPVREDHPQLQDPQLGRTAPCAVAFDCEGVPEHVHLLQVASATHAYVFDCHTLGVDRVCEALRPLLTTPLVLKLAHDVHRDAQALQEHTGVILAGVLDTQVREHERTLLEHTRRQQIKRVTVMLAYEGSSCSVPRRNELLVFSARQWR